MAPACAIVHPTSDQSRRERAADRIWDTELAPASFDGGLPAREQVPRRQPRIQAGTLPYLGGARNIPCAVLSTPALSIRLATR
jgi:hypothetical protein